MASTINASTSSGLVQSGDTSGVLQLQTNSGQTAVTINTSQNVGIGTTSPDQKLHVDTSGPSAIAISRSSGTNDNTGFQVKQATTSWYFGANASNKFGFRYNNPDLTTPNVTIDTSGNVGIGTTTPNYGTWTKAFTGFSTGNFGVEIATSSTTSGNAIGAVDFIQTSNTNVSNKEVAQVVAVNTGTTSGNTGAYLYFSTKPDNGTIAERMRIDSSGNVMIGSASPGSTSRLSIVDANNRTSSTAQLNIEGAGYQELHWLDGTACYIGQNSASRELRMFAGATPTTGVKLTNGATSWVSTSDENLKDIIEPIENAVEKISTLRTVIGKYKDDEENTRRPFLIAQDVEKVLPEAIHVGSDDTLNLSYTETIPLLVAAIKEQQTIINDLKARITALEGAK